MKIDQEKLEEWKNKNSQAAGYAHFDEKFGLNSAWEYITNPDKIKSHSFFPFITYDHISYKAIKGNNEIRIKAKTRPICYCSHIDRCVYQYYSYLLNEEYNKYANKEEISQSVVAYRTNMHKNNIHFAKQAFDFIKRGDCKIIVGDFKGFFESLDHKYLKEMLCKVLNEEKISDDWYAVYKNITRYSTWDLIDILKLNGLLTDEDIENKNLFHKEALGGNTRKARNFIKYMDKQIKTLNGFYIEDVLERYKKLALTKEQFKYYKKDYLKKHNCDFGIPQGSPISAVLSNVYMIEFDKQLTQFTRKFNGLYLRYSDDFIVILPKCVDITIVDLRTYLTNLVDKTKGLSLEESKTKLYLFENKNILKIVDKEKTNFSHIDYLGFVFDGKEIVIRQKTISKYYYRMYKKLNHIVKSKGMTKKNNKISYEELYKTYTQKGRNGQYDKDQLPKKIIIKDEINPYKSGNFFSYVYKADRIFNPEYVGKSKTKNPISHKEPITRSTQKHMLKIRRVRTKINKPKS